MQIYKIAHAVLLACGDHIIFRLLLLQHQPLHLNIVSRMAPVPFRIEISEIQRVLQSDLDAAQCARDFARHKRLTALRRLVIEQDPIAGKNSVSLTVVDRNPIRIELCDRIGRAGIKRRCLFLRRFPHQAVEFRSRGLVKARQLFESGNANRLKQAQGAQRIGIRRVFRLLERNFDVTLCREVVDLVRLHFLHNADEAAGIGQIAVVQNEMAPYWCGSS